MSKRELIGHAIEQPMEEKLVLCSRGASAVPGSQESLGTICVADRFDPLNWMLGDNPTRIARPRTLPLDLIFRTRSS